MNEHLTDKEYEELVNSINKEIKKQKGLIANISDMFRQLINIYRIRRPKQ